ncbi:MAG: glycosyltransferase family 1 protein [Candidatus Abyssubacteria bacterium]
MRVGINGATAHRPATGCERYLFELLTHLCKVGREHEYTVYTKAPVFTGRLPGANVQERTCAYTSEMILTDFLREGGPEVDVYHMTWFGDVFNDFLPLRLAPASVLTVHDLMQYRYRSYFSDESLHAMHRARCKRMIGAADMIIAVSEYTRTDILRNFDVDPEKVRTVLEGASTRLSNMTDDESIQKVRTKYGLSKPYLFYLATDYPHKNHKNLLLAFHHLVSERQRDVQLVFAGARFYLKGIPLLEELTRNLQRSNRLIRLEHVDDGELAVLYHGAELFVYPSLDEGFGLPLLEAMACGTPVASSRAASLPEVGGDAAVYFDPLDVRDMVEVIERALHDTNLRRELVDRGHRRCSELTWEKTAEQTLAVYADAQGMAKKCRSPLDPAADAATRNILSEVMNDCLGFEKNYLNLVKANEEKDRYLDMILNSRSVRYYGKLRDVARKILAMTRDRG